MSFNKRYVNGKGIAAAFENKGLQGVVNYFSKPDALIVPMQLCWAKEVASKFDTAFKADKYDEFEKYLEKSVKELKDLEIKLFVLRNNLAMETDSEIVAYLNANIQIADKKLATYYV